MVSWTYYIIFTGLQTINAIHRLWELLYRIESTSFQLIKNKLEH